MREQNQTITFYSQSDLLQSSVLQNGLGHVPVLDVLEEAVQFGAVDDWRGTEEINSSVLHHGAPMSPRAL